MINKNLHQFLGRIRVKLAGNHPLDPPEKSWQPDLNRSAVLIPITFHEDQIKLIFTKRSELVERHRGQVSFPGGMIEVEDKNPFDTAVRETCEEINIQPSQIEILGLMPPFNSQTGFFIYPVAGYLHNLEGLERNGDEVERIFCIPFDWLADPCNSELKDYKRLDGSTKKVWFFNEYDGELLWGVTAKIVKEFIALIEN